MTYKIDGQFAPMTEKLLTSKAWAAAGTHVRRLIDFLIVEHLRHGGQENGNLKAPWRQLGNHATGARISERLMTETLDQAVALGLIDLNRGSRRRPSTFGLTWLPLHDGTPPSNRFLQCNAAADAILAAAKAAKRRSTSWRPGHGLPAQSERKFCLGKVKANLPTQSEGKSPFLPAQSEGKKPDSKPTQSEGTIYKALPGSGQDKYQLTRKGSVDTGSVSSGLAGDPWEGDGLCPGNGDGGHESKPDPTRTCGRYVTNAVGFRICGKPVVSGMDICPEHAELRIAVSTL